MAVDYQLEAKEANKLKLVVMLTASISYSHANCLYFTRRQNNPEVPDSNSLSAHGSNF